MQAVENAQKPAKPMVNSLNQFNKEKTKGDLYNPENLTGDEQKVFNFFKCFVLF
jgi:hypothetical protein